MRKPKDQKQPTLFELPPRPASELRIRVLEHPIWTEHKARFVARYLYFFVLVAKHGTYVDGFAAPQRPRRPETWTAKLVLESQPARLRHFHLCDLPAGARYLDELQRRHAERDVQIHVGDFNDRVTDILRSVADREATFCLLDQRTFECHWATVKLLAQHKAASKIELFYLLADAWLGRALSATKDQGKLDLWWGGSGWSMLRDLSPQERGLTLARRFRDELGYSWSAPFPIYNRPGGGRIMYFMIHATDHPSAPDLMSRAYNDAVLPIRPCKQLELDLDLPQPS